MTEAFAAVGAFATFAVAAMILVMVAALLVTSIKNWLLAKSEIVRTVERLAETQAMLMKANNNLNERLKSLESEVRDD